MATFVTGKNLEDSVYNIIWEAKSTLLIVSPFIKLDTYFMKLFEHHIGHFDLHIILVFGKNEGNASKSLSKSDFDFFKQFPKISIIYVSNLHAKYFGNERAGVITSINLHDYSFKNNIEFGVYSENGLLGAFSQSSDQQAFRTCLEIADKGEPVFIRRPVFQRPLMSLITGSKKFIKAATLLDNTEYYYLPGGRKSALSKHLPDFEDELDFDQNEGSRPSREQIECADQGYCIRTGIRIPFNPTKPMCDDAYKSWSAYRNSDYKEKYCHKTGQPSHGKTSMRNPILG